MRHAGSPPRPLARSPLRRLLTGALLSVLLLTTSCMVGPNYKWPSAPVPQAFKESPPAGWKEAQPSDGALKGKWWEVYNDPRLNGLEEQVSITNQNVLAAEAQFRAARYAVRVARAQLFPTVTASPSITTSRFGHGGASASGGAVFSSGSNIVTTYDFPVSLSYMADVWGSIRRTVRASEDTAQATFAELENARLSFQSELAEDYFELLGTYGDQDLLESTVKSYQEYLELTQNRFNAGVASGADVAQAQTQLDTTKAQLIDLGVALTQFEHAIAVLTGKPPADLSLPHAIIKSPPPPVPVALPSELLERRPDIATSERQMASANEEVGIAVAAFYPTVSLTGSVGFTATDFVQWFQWPSRFFSAGGQAAEVLFSGGKLHAQLGQMQAMYDASVATYRQTVLTAFQQVEDNLSALRVLEEESAATDKAVKAAQQSLDISTYQYKAGTVAYLQVLTAQAALLGNQRTAVDLLTRRMTSSVLLIQALGGGWDAKALPTSNELIHGH